MMKKKLIGFLLTLVMAAACGMGGCGNSGQEKPSSQTEQAGNAGPEAGETAEDVSQKDETQAEDSKEQETEEAAADQETVDYAGLADELAALVTDDDISQVDTAMAAATYGIEEAQIADCKVFLSSGATASEVAVFSMKDQDGVKELLELLNERLEERTESFADYAPDEVPKLENAVLLNKGTCVVFAVVADADAAQDIIKNY